MKKYKIPIILLGNNKTGKTSFSTVLQNHNDYKDKYTETIGVNYFRRRIIIDLIEYVLIIWDLTGSHRFIPIMDSYLKEAKFIFLFFSHNKKDSIDDLYKWDKLIKSKCEKNNLKVFLLGSWSDKIGCESCIDLTYIEDVCNNLGYTKYNVYSTSLESVNRVIKDILNNLDILKLEEMDIKVETFNDIKNKTSSTKTCFYDILNCFGNNK